jgi:alpha-tubulin suppressor-like RCC1 family protein
MLIGGCGDGHRLSNDVVPIAANHLLASVSTTCAIRKSGLFCWGYNSWGALGTGTTEDGYVGPVEAVVAGSDAVEVSVGDSHTCVRHASGQVSCWGGNQYGQLGSGSVSQYSTEAITVPGIDDALEIAAGFDSTCVRRADGTVSCWGAAEAPASNPGSLVPVTIRGLTDVVQIAGGRYNYCARRGDGDVLCWSFFYEGPSAPKPMRLPAARDLSAGESVCVTAQASGDVTCQDPLYPSADPMPVLHGAIQLAAGDVTCAVDGSGGVSCFDPLHFFGSTDSVVSFSSDLPAVEVAVGAFWFCARRTDDSIDCRNWITKEVTPVDNLPP